jgi:anti-sigma factor RsiW
MTQSHLTEDELHGLADGSLSAEHLAAADAHVRACTECSADIDRIRGLLKRVNESMSQEPSDAVEIDKSWPSIRSRIEQQKVVALPATRMATADGSVVGRTRRVVAIAGVVAAGIMTAWLARGREAPVESPLGAETTADSGISLISLVDSTHAYQEEAQALLNHLELRRATLRPELSRALERDLRTIDVAIAELQDAIKNDPANPSLRRLLASSYRQKVDLLKRVSNAG